MKLLEKLYSIYSPSKREINMQKFIERCLEHLNVKIKVDEIGNVYVTKGNSNSFPCIIAHMDQVQPPYTSGFETIIFRNEIIFGYDNIYKKYNGLGADDKNGIWIALKALEKYENLKCVFFVEEESGGFGSKYCNINFFKNCRFIIQCDRRGNSDLVTDIYGIKLASDHFIKSINPKFNNYKETHGMFTDVYNLVKRNVGISCINISCGYYNPHTDEEYTRVEDLYKCQNFVDYIISNCTSIYKHQLTLSKKNNKKYFDDLEDYEYYYGFGNFNNYR